MDFNNLKHQVIDRGLCTTCGTCIGVCPSRSLLFEETDDELLPVLNGSCNGCGICIQSCPGQQVPILEMERKLFGRERKLCQPDYGVYRSLGYGYSTNQEIRKNGSSGGVITALLVYALEEGFIDAALVAGFDPKHPWRTFPIMATSKKEILQAAQSKYAPVAVNKLLSESVAESKKLAVVGLPCQVHALRKIQLSGKPQKIAQSIELIFGLCCAAQFYVHGTRHALAELGGVLDPEVLQYFTYRGGRWPGHMVGEDWEGGKIEIDRHQYMYHLLLPGYKRDRCEVCIDWSSELADISAGDYWPRIGGTEGGYTALFIRTKKGETFFQKALSEGKISFSPLKEGDHSIASSVGYEMKKHAAAFRLRQRKRYGWPVPEYDYIPEGEPFLREFHFAPERKG